MTTLRSSDYEAGWRLRLTFGDGEYASGVLDDEGAVRGGGKWYDLPRRLGERVGKPTADERVTAITVLDRPSPFEMGARVVGNDCAEVGCVATSHEVTGWDPANGKIDVDHRQLFAWYPHELTLAPEPPQAEVGSWWRSGRDIYVCVKADASGWVSLRRWTDVPAWEWNVAKVRALLTRLDGPPEPAIGDVYEIAGTVWHRGTDGLHRRVGSRYWWHWKHVVAEHTRADLATLRIIGNVGGEG